MSLAVQYIKKRDSFSPLVSSHLSLPLGSSFDSHLPAARVHHSAPSIDSREQPARVALLFSSFLRCLESAAAAATAAATRESVCLVFVAVYLMFCIIFVSIPPTRRVHVPKFCHMISHGSCCDRNAKGKLILLINRWQPTDGTLLLLPPFFSFPLIYKENAEGGSGEEEGAISSSSS